MQFSFGAQQYTSGSNTFTFPAGVYWVYATGIAGGGGGASTSKTPGPFLNPGGGGGAGECIEGFIIYGLPGSTINCTVGAGGAKGDSNVSGLNAGNVVGNNGGVGAGFGGADTIIGPVRLVGGYGGIRGNNGGAGGMGGGWGATRASNGLGASGSNGGQQVGGVGSAGTRTVKKNCVKWFSGSGGGAGNGGASGNGGAFGPWSGGVFGASTAQAGGAGGGAGLYGPGGDGGAGDASAPAALTSPPNYGAGGGGAGSNNGTSSGPATQTAYAGADGVDGYILLAWIAQT